jgi:hypothetical protein
MNGGSQKHKGEKRFIANRYDGDFYRDENQFKA